MSPRRSASYPQGGDEASWHWKRTLVTVAGLGLMIACTGEPQPPTQRPALLLGQAGRPALLQAEQEPNNSPEEANAVTAVESLLGEATVLVDPLDFYRFRLGAAGRYRFLASAAGGIPRLAVIDGLSGERFAAQDGVLDLALLAQRDYLIEVAFDGGDATHQDYEIRLFLPVPGDPPVCGSAADC